MNASPTEIAWAAGLFEGEGCIYFQQRADRSAALQMVTTDEDVLRLFHDIVGCGSVKPRRAAREGWKPTWSWYVGRAQDVLDVLNAFWPYLGERRRAKAMEAIERASKIGETPNAPFALRAWRAQKEIF